MGPVCTEAGAGLRPKCVELVPFLGQRRIIYEPKRELWRAGIAGWLVFPETATEDEQGRAQRENPSSQSRELDERDCSGSHRARGLPEEMASSTNEGKRRQEPIHLKT